MKNKILLLIAVATLGLTATTLAQVPSYVPSNGLVGWWPFNGNANDESGNGNNGTVNGATLTTDRNGNANQAYSFDGINNFIEISNSTSLNFTQGTINIWFYTSQTNFMNLIERTIFSNASNENWGLAINQTVSGDLSLYTKHNSNCLSGNGWQTNLANQNLSINNWHMLSGVIKNSTSEIYLDGLLVNTYNTPSIMDVCGGDIQISRHWLNDPRYFTGSIDDIGIWNRALTQQEIADLYNSCQLAVNAQPANQTININNNAQFIVGSSDTNATYQWQTDLGVGFQNVSNTGQYNGTSNDTLSVANVSMSNNNQSFRCIINSGSCADTSNVVVLTINNNVGIHEIAQHNLFSVFPNPAHNVINVKADHKLIGSVFTIYDNTGKAVQSGKINAANTSIELSNLSSGFYMFSLGENRKQSFKIIKE